MLFPINPPSLWHRSDTGRVCGVGFILSKLRDFYEQKYLTVAFCKNDNEGVCFPINPPPLRNAASQQTLFIVSGSQFIQC